MVALEVHTDACCDFVVFCRTIIWRCGSRYTHHTEIAFNAANLAATASNAVLRSSVFSPCDTILGNCCDATRKSVHLLSVATKDLYPFSMFLYLGAKLVSCAHKDTSNSKGICIGSN